MLAITKTEKKYRITQTGLQIESPLTYDEWLECGSELIALKSAVQWAIGDWLLYGEGRDAWGEMYTQAMDETRMSYESLKQYVWVASAFQLCTRVHNLSWSHHRVAAHIPDHDKRAEVLQLALQYEWSSRELAEYLKPKPPTNVPVPVGKYRCIVIDPPWEVKKIEREVRPRQGSELEYPTMSLEAIAALPIPDLVHDQGCHLYLWTTQKYLPDALTLLPKWGFNYQCLMTWVKPSGMTPFSWMYNTEHVIFATRGNLPLVRVGLKLSFDAPVIRHSSKPDVFYERVRQASPEPRLEMFARQEHEAFIAWGDQVGVRAEKAVS